MTATSDTLSKSTPQWDSKREKERQTKGPPSPCTVSICHAYTYIVFLYTYAGFRRSNFSQN